MLLLWLSFEEEDDEEPEEPAPPIGKARGTLTRVQTDTAELEKR